MDKTLFFMRDLLVGYGGTNYAGGVYDAYWWTYPGADDPLAPDDEPDPYAAERGDVNLRRPRHFMLTKNVPDKLTAARRKRNLINILGADWTVDANDVPGGYSPTFDGVTYTAKFTLWRDRLNEIGLCSITGRRSWERQFAEIKNKLSGKTWLISPQEDRWYYREGRVDVTDTSKGERGELTITADCDPWKYEKYSTMDEWEWDDLDFESGIIREREDYIRQDLSYGATVDFTILPLEKKEPVWINVITQNDSTFGYFKIWRDDESEPDDNDKVEFTTADLGVWKQTEITPEEPTALEKKHVIHFKSLTPNTNKITVKVLYRGAML